MPELDAEDQKLVTLARSARARTQAAEGAALRDTDGRTYAASTVDQPSFKLTALQAAVAAAVSSGAEGIEAAVVVSGDALLNGASLQAVRDIAEDAPVYLADPSGKVLS
ncbi:cytidine deaminase [Amycolatopsis roodepoortensis]|uniref:Cytidine deaminase n=1 Tax=Amycolatopsis roodepoortensis TaxID=700274 RepID=A0ABR9LF52_9PSEU|nr:cytidine deaminase [Amycolatopsis roodepoortensis]MBE1578922.1 cytidine deaminase [Amycolatopsis roodepoortensis]UUV34154.1 cytidine deaminase [Amycolatopsis roodepoortensis]